MDSSQIEALISLIEDPDEIIFDQVKGKIISLGEPVIPFLENYWENNSFDNRFQIRIENIIHEIQFEHIERSLVNWVEDGCHDLLEGVLTINRYQYPDLDETELRDFLSKLRQDIWLELNDNLTAFEKIKIFNHFLFELSGFRGNKKNYHAPQNSFLNKVIESRRGNPLSISIIYLIVARSLELPIYGINLPNHFILGYLDEFKVMDELMEDELPGDKNGDILFYINPFSQGTILHKDEIDSFLSHLNLDQNPLYYTPCSYLDIIKRLLNNLLYSYQKMGFEDKVEELTRLQKVLD